MIRRTSLVAGSGMVAVLALVQQVGPPAYAELLYGTARVETWSSDCPAAKLQLLDTQHGALPVNQARLVEAYVVVDDLQADDGVNALETADIVTMEVDNGLSTILPKPITLTWTGEFIGISNGEPDPRPTPLVVSAQAVGPFGASEADSVLAARCR
jgi:hypothetical protein